MKIIKKVNQSEVFGHWENVEKISITQRADIVFPLVAYQDLFWNLVEVESIDLDKIYIISSDDWKKDGLCDPDFKLITAIQNYIASAKQEGKYADIKAKEDVFISKPEVLDIKFILVSNNESGPYTIIEGNKRSVALGKLNTFVGLKVYLGVSPAIKHYVWSRHSY